MLNFNPFGRKKSPSQLRGGAASPGGNTFPSADTPTQEEDHGKSIATLFADGGGPTPGGGPAGGHNPHGYRPGGMSGINQGGYGGFPTGGHFGVGVGGEDWSGEETVEGTPHGEVVWANLRSVHLAITRLGRTTLEELQPTRDWGTGEETEAWRTVVPRTQDSGVQVPWGRRGQHQFVLGEQLLTGVEEEVSLPSLSTLEWQMLMDMGPPLRH